MTIEELIARLVTLSEEYGNNTEVDILTETERSGQVEQSLADIAYSPRDKRIKLLPKDF